VPKTLSKVCIQTSLLLLCLLLTGSARAESATIEIQGVSASDPGKKNPAVPATLDAYKAELLNTTFGSFKDAGHQSVTAATGAKGSATLDKYTIEMALTRKEGRKKIEITIKVGGRALTTPVGYPLARGQRFSMQVGAKDAPMIIVFTVKEVE